jgi:hypothetical protein
VRSDLAVPGRETRWDSRKVLWYLYPGCLCMDGIRAKGFGKHCRIFTPVLSVYGRHPRERELVSCKRVAVARNRGMNRRTESSVVAQIHAAPTGHDNLLRSCKGSASALRVARPTSSAMTTQSFEEAELTALALASAADVVETASTGDRSRLTGTPQATFTSGELSAAPALSATAEGSLATDSGETEKTVMAEAVAVTEAMAKTMDAAESGEDAGTTIDRLCNIVVAQNRLLRKMSTQDAASAGEASTMHRLDSTRRSTSWLRTAHNSLRHLIDDHRQQVGGSGSGRRGKRRGESHARREARDGHLSRVAAAKLLPPLERRIEPSFGVVVIVVGCGAHGRNIAGELLRRGCHVRLYDSFAEQAQYARMVLEAIFMRHVEEGLFLLPDVERMMSHCTA